MNYDYKIVVDSCCELPDEYLDDPRFEIVPLTLMVGEHTIIDDDTFDQVDFLKKVAECPECPKSACPSPERFMEAYHCDAKRVYCVTLSSKLSGSYNSAHLAIGLHEETYGEKDIHVFDSLSASVGETQIALKIVDLEEKGLSFDDIVAEVEKYRDEMQTIFVLDNLETLRKNGRMSKLKSFVASTLNIKPVLYAVSGEIAQKSQAIGVKKAMTKLADLIDEMTVRGDDHMRLIISHCNNLERAEMVKQLILSRRLFDEVIILNDRGVSTMYANEGGIIVTA